MRRFWGLGALKTSLQVEPHSTQVFMNQKASYFLDGEYFPYPFAFYAQNSINEIYNINTSNLRFINPETSDLKTHTSSPRAIDHFTKGLKGENFYVDFENSFGESFQLLAHKVKWSLKLSSLKCQESLEATQLNSTIKLLFIIISDSTGRPQQQYNR